MKTHAYERGQTLPLIGMAALLLVGIAGFAADVGYHQYQQRVQQTATDSAALAGAAELAAGGYTKATAAGKRDSSSNGFTDGTNNVTVTVGAPAAGDPFSGNTHAVQAGISAQYPTFFERVFGITTATVSTKAVAIDNAPSDLCMLALSTTGTSTVNAHTNVNAPTCSMAFNNAHLSIGGQSTITTETPIQYSGTLTGAGNSTFSPSAPVSALPLSDPCDQIASCLYIKQNPPATTPCVNFNAASPQANQIYCSMDFGNGTVNLPAGYYVVTGDLHGNNATVNGTNVTIIDTSTNCPNINNVTLNITAPTSGNYAGMLFYDKGCANPITMNAGNTQFSGAIYVPNATLNMNAGTAIQTILITGTLSLNAAGTTFSSPPGVQLTTPRLVE